MAERRPLYDAGAGGIKEFDPASGDTLAGAGAGGSSGINYVTNPDFEVDTAGWAAYADAAGVAPVDGTGGSPTVTITRSTSSPLRKTASGLITKDAANRQGNGVSYDFTIDSAQKGRALSVLFDYIVGSGTFAAGDASSDGDITVYIYDVTNTRLIPLSDRKLYSNSATLSSKFIGLFQASPDSTSYRLIIHCGSTSASAYTLKFDEVQVSPLAYFPATVVTNWQPFPSTAAGTLITAVTTNPTYGTVEHNVALWRRVGDSMEIIWVYRHTGTGSNGSGTYLFNLPPGYQIDTTKLPANTSFRQSMGSFSYSDAGGTIADGSVSVYSATQLWAHTAYVAVSGTANVISPWSSSIGGFANTGLSVSIKATVPIAGWGSAITSALTGDDGRVIAASYWQASNVASDSSTPIAFASKEYDTHGAVSLSPFRFTAPTWGIYKISGFVNSGSASTPVFVYKNGTAHKIIGYLASSIGISELTGEVELRAGDYIDVRTSSNSTINGNASQNSDSASQIQISKLGGNAVAVGQINEKWPVGSYIQHAGATAPSGFLACDGTAVSRLDYSALFAVIGTTYGAGNGTTTFNLPDARGLVMVGAGAHGSMTRANGSAYDGGSVGASRNDQLQGFWLARSSVSDVTSGSGTPLWRDGTGTATTFASDGVNGTPRTGNETRPAEIAVLVCIKY